MKKKFLVFLSYVLVAALSSVLSIGMMFGMGADISKLDQLTDLIEDYYIEDVSVPELEDVAAEAMVNAAGDRWSYYIPASEYAAYRETSENAYVGIGITITVAHDGDGLQVMQVNPGSSAEEAGMLVDDVIIAIEGQSASGMSTTDARNLVRGKEGTAVALTVRRGSEELTMSVIRRKVQVPVAQWEMLDNHIGLVTIANFDERCAEETIAAIEALLAEGAEKLIFDVRGNPGGYADELVEVLDYLLPEGDLFRTVDYAGRENVDTSDADCLEMPMAVLVDGESYSAAEFFAAALQEYEAAVVVGVKTTGKGYFQSTFRMSDGSAVALSIGKYFTPKGISLEGVGIEPDVKVPVDEETMLNIYYDKLQPQEDPQIQAAVEALQ
ncbi:MAG: S41 family peptidase [Oscillospiraceae bacterium]|nr:S41 family peptidase [Oscillospiraceae bacterium]